MSRHHGTPALTWPWTKGIPSHSLGLFRHTHATVGQYSYWLKGRIHLDPRDSEL